MTPDTRFGTVADEYDRVRPRWPAAVADFVLAGLRPAVLVEVGAGTGQLTRTLVGRAARLVAIEPDPALRSLLGTVPGGVETPDGAAERIPLADGSADAVLAAQALHWFRRPDADREIARVLRRGGVAGLISSTPDTGQPWVAALAETWPRPIRRSSPGTLAGTWFEPGQRWQLRHVHPLAGIADLVELIRTWRWTHELTEAELATVRTRIVTLAADHPELRGDSIGLPMTTTVIRQYRI